MLNPDEGIALLLDEAAIRRTTAKFADAATRGDHDEFRKVWADECEFTIGDPPRMQARGIEDVAAMFRKLRSERDFFVQFAIQGPITIAGDTATTSCIVHEAARGPGEHYYRNHCVVSDRLIRTGDGWVFARRAFHYLWLDTSPFTGDAFKLPSQP